MGVTRWAILGTGAVARKFALGLDALGGRAAVGAVASRDPAKARAFTASLGRGQAVDRYEDAVADPAVDAVYIATPPDFHEAHAALAFAAGKPALIEKPLAHDAASAARIAAAAEAAGVFAMEAMWTRFQPLVRQVADLVENGRLGELRGFHGVFLGATDPDPATSLFARGTGGALLHRGVYPLSLARHFLGPVRDVAARGRIGETGVDEDAVLVLTHASGALSTIRASLRTGGPGDMRLWGTAGRIEIDGPVWRPVSARLHKVSSQPAMAPRPRRAEAFRESALGQRLADLKTRLTGPRPRRLAARLAGNGYGHEAEELMDCVARGALTSDIMPLQQSVEIMEIVDRARAAMESAP